MRLRLSHQGHRARLRLHGIREAVSRDMLESGPIHAVGQTTVKSYRPTVFDEVAGAPTLSDVHLTEIFSGDIEGEGVAHVVQAARADGAATFAGLERVRGAIGGKQG